MSHPPPPAVLDAATGAVPVEAVGRLFALTRNLLCVTGPEGYFLHVNPAWEHTLGWTVDELLGRPVLDFVHPDDRAATVMASREVRADGVLDPFVNRYQCRGGSYRWLSWIVSAPDAQGRCYCIATDVTAQQTAEARLRASEALLLETQEIANVGSWSWEVGTGATTWSDELYRIQGFAPGAVEASYERFIGLVHPEDRARVEADHAEVVRTGGTFAHDYRIVRPDGTERTLHCRGRVTHGRDGGVVRVAGSCQDVTERVRTVEALQESQARYDRIAAKVPGMVFQYVLAPDGTVALPYVSAGAREIYGLSPEAMQRDPQQALALVHPDDRAEWARSVDESAATLERWRCEFRLLLPSGEERWVQGAAQPQRQPDGSIVWDGLLLDITDRRRAEARAQRQHELLQAILDHIPAMVTVTSATGEPVFANAEWARLSGWSWAEARTLDLLAELYPDPAERARVATFIRAATGRPGEFRMRARDGRTLQTSWASVALSDGSVVGLGLDVSERDQLESQLRQAQKMEAIGQLAGGVAHDFNNLLQVIMANTRFARETLPPGTPASEDLAAVDEATARAVQLTRQLLVFSRKQLLKPEVIDLNRVVEGVTPLLRRLIGEDIRVLTLPGASLAPVVADPGQLEQVLMNLAVNARDAMPNGGTLRIETANVEATAAEALHRGAVVEPGAYVRLTVRDTGVGMGEGTVARIFEPFFTTKASGQGTGLGLSTVYGIVKQSGGHVWVTSAPGEGTRFDIDLPAAAAPATSVVAETASRGADRGTETVLLVEDDAAVRASVRRILTQAGYTVLTAANGRDALREVEASVRPIHLVLTDIVMPEMSGREFVEQLTVHHPDLRVLCMSGYTDDEIVRRGLVVPNAALLEKPFTPERLLDEVRAALSRTARREGEV
ncbi:MAG: PAS domain-containing protein [Gemmatirosa sp.]